MPYDATVNIETSASAEVSVAYVAPGDFAGEINIFRCHEKNLFCFRKFMELVEAGRANVVADATAKDNQVKIKTA